MNRLEPLQQLDGNLIRWRGRTWLGFSGCDYFRLTRHPAVLRAAAAGLHQFGLNVSASRLTTGHHRIYARLETELANFFGAPEALLLPGGYATSTVVAQALAGEFTHVLLDARAHPALRDAALHFGCPVRPFKHADPADLARVAARCGRRARIIVLTDGLFSHDGSAAPLAAYLAVLPRTAQLLVDDAHGAGVLGAHGRGAPEHAGVPRRRIIQCVTLSKAFGSYGGAVLGARALREKILARSRAFIGCTPLPPPLANAALQAVKILRRDGRRRARLRRNAEYVKAALRAAGWTIPAAPGPILVLHPRSVAQRNSVRRQLLAAGIYPPFLKYAGSPAGFFRFVISSEHKRAQLDLLVRVLADAAVR